MKEKSRRSRVDALRSQSWLLNCKDGCILGGCRELVFQIMILTGKSWTDKALTICCECSGTCAILVAAGGGRQVRMQRGIMQTDGLGSTESLKPLAST
jgi:streptolysin S family bacteriocin protoxin